MTSSLPDHLLLQFSELVASQMGLHFPRERWPDLEKGIRSFASESCDAPDVETCLKQILSKPLARHQIETLACALTVGETYFFRDKRSFEILGERVLPPLIAARQGNERRLRVWSAGCCTGEEAYSIAISIDRILPSPSQWHITILGTDINPRFLQKAADGIFSDWSFRDAPPWLKQTYFTQVGPHRFEILPRIKQMVTFAYLNLAEDVYPSLSNGTNAMDLIFCRNVLMYFSPQRATKVIHSFHRALVDSGRLFVSAVESSTELFYQFLAEHSADAVLYQKAGSPERQSAASFPHDLERWPSVRTDTANFTQLPGSPTVHLPEPQAPALLAADAEELLTPLEQGLALFEQGHYAEAVAKLKGCSDVAQTPGISGLVARACANSGKLAEARQWAEKAISEDKLNAASHYLLATVLQEQGDIEEAVAILKRALYLEPDFVLVHFALGNHAWRQGNLKEAGKHFNTAITLLAAYQSDALLPHSDGLAAGRLRAMIESTQLALQVK